MCKKCETLLIIAFNFRKAIKESNEFLEHIFQKIRAYEETVDGVIPNDERGRKVEELKRKIFSNNYCRFCYMECTLLTHLNTSVIKYNDMFLLDMFKKITNFSVTQTELSFSICKSCENQLIQIYDGCIAAQKNFSYVKTSLQQAQKAMKEGTLKIERYQIKSTHTKTTNDDSENYKTHISLIEPEFIKLEPVDASCIDLKEEEDNESTTVINGVDPMSVDLEKQKILCDNGDVDMIVN